MILLFFWKIIAFASMTCIVNLDAKQLHSQDEKVFNNFIFNARVLHFTYDRVNGLLRKYICMLMLMTKYGCDCCIYTFYHLFFCHWNPMCIAWLQTHVILVFKRKVQPSGLWTTWIACNNMVCPQTHPNSIGLLHNWNFSFWESMHKYANATWEETFFFVGRL